MEDRPGARDRGDPDRCRDRDRDRGAGDAHRHAGRDRGRGRGAGTRPDRRALRNRAHQRLRRADPAFGARPAKGGGREMTPLIAASAYTYWGIALVIGLSAALIVAGLLAMLLRAVFQIDRSASQLLGVA